MSRWVVALVGLALGAASAAAPSARLDLTVVDAALRPVPGVAVSMACCFAPAARIRDEHVSSDAAGRIAIESVPPGPYRLHLWNQPYHPWQSGRVDLAPGENRLEAVLWPLAESAAIATVEALVIGRDGRPAAHTDVEVDIGLSGWLTCGPAALRAGVLGLRHCSANDCDLFGVLKTDAQGRVRCVAPPGRLTVSITARHEEHEGQQVWAPPGRTTWVRARLADARPAVKAGLAPLPPITRLRGRLVDAAEQPLAGLRVVFVPPPGTGHHESEEAWVAPRRPGQPQGPTAPPETDAQGCFTFDTTITRPAPLRLKAAGWASSGLEMIDPTDPTPVVFSLTERACTVRGRVVDAAGRPVPGAVAWAEPLAGLEMPLHPLPELTAETSPSAGAPPLPDMRGWQGGGMFAVPCDAAGRFVFDELDPAAYRFRAGARGWGEPSVARRVPGASPGPELVLKLTRLATLTGRARRPDGSPWPGAPLRVEWGTREQQAEANADRDGRWRVTDLPPGRRRFVVALPGCLDQVADLDLRGGVTAAWAVPTQAGHTLSGQLVAGDGTPLAAAQVYCSRPGRVPSVSWTDAAGRFALTGLQTGDRRLDIETALGPEAPVYVKLPRDELVIRLPRRATLSGTVVDQGGRPLSGALCRLAPRGPHGEEPSREVTTDAAGRFSFALLRPGPYRLSVERDGFRHFGTHVTLRPGEHQGGLTARLQPFPPDWRLTGNATVRGRVVRLDGTPAVGAEVTCLAAGRSQQAKTDATGAYRLTGLLAGAVHLAARLAGCASEPATGQAKANAETVLPDLKLAERLVRGRLVDLPPGIRPRYCLVSAGVLAQGADGREVPHTAAFLLPVLRETEEAWQRAAPVGVSPLWSDPEPMTHSPFGYLRFPTASRVTMGLQLGLADTDEPVLARGDGSFELPLGPGQQRLTVTTPYPRDGRGDLVTLAEVVVDIPERGPVALEVPLVLGTAVLAGQLTLPKAAGKAAVSRALWNVAAYRPGSWTPAATTLVRPDGGWRLAGLTPGDYRVVIGGYGGCRLQQATAHAGATTTVVCDTRPGHTLRGRLRARPARPMQLTVESDTAVQAVLVQPDGAFVLPDLPAGVYRCTLWAGHGTKLVRLPGTVTVPGADVVLDG